jgi:hypothetical protein
MYEADIMELTNWDQVNKSVLHRLDRGSINLGFLNRFLIAKIL